VALNAKPQEAGFMAGKRISIIAFAFLLFSVNIACGQVGRESGLWTWTDSADHHKSIVQVSTVEGTGTGIIISVDQAKKIKDGYEGYCLTAWHVVKENLDDDNIRILYRNGRKAKKCKVVVYDKDRDIAVLWVWVPEQIPAAKLATQPIRSGDQLEFCGLGGGSDIACCVRHFAGTASSPSSMQRIFADVPLLPGDSGGPVFNANHEVVGIISGGWFWYDGGVKTETGSEIKATWPARASNVKPIQELIARAGVESDEGSKKY